ncbi:MAG: DMT family transporter [Proteobacteria bacterium]|nr:DMT family transporter [Pseudomonadota bacterium]
MLSTSSPQMRLQYLASISCIVAAILWGVLWYPLRLLEAMGFHGLWSALLLYCSAIFFIIIPCWQKRSVFLENKIEYVLLSLFAGWTNLAFILAMLEGEVVRVLLLFYLSPIWAILMAIFILGERLTLTNAIALIIAMLGAILMLWQTDLDYMVLMSRADLFAISSGLAFAMTNIVVRKTGDVPLQLKMGSAWLGVIVLTLLGLFIVEVPRPLITIQSGLLVFLLGFPFMFVMTWTAQYGVTHLPIQRSSILFLMEIVAGAVSAALLTNEIVQKNEYFGGVLIIAAGLMSVLKSDNTRD